MFSDVNKGRYKAFAGLIILATIFFVMSYITQEYEDAVRLIIGEKKTIGMLIYVFITTVAVVVAPVSTLPLIPLASGLWGWVIAGVLSITGWLLGAEIAFLLGRHYGKPLVQRIVSVEKLEQFERHIPEDHLFWTVVFLRMFVSVDLLSWALGLFSSMKNLSYITATLIGITPFAFIFAYTGTLSTPYQAAILIVAAGITLIWYILYRKKYSRA